MPVPLGAVVVALRATNWGVRMVTSSSAPGVLVPMPILPAM